MAKGITTGKGVFSYPKFFRPDEKYGVFSGPITLPLDDPRSQELVKIFDEAWTDAIETARKEAVKKGKNPKVKECEDKPWTVDEDAGTLVIRAKKKGEYKDKKTEQMVKTRVPVFGPDGKPITQDPGTKFASGSVGKITFEINAFETPKLGVGLPFRLLAVQVLEMKEWIPTGESYGFSADEEAMAAAAADTAGEDAPEAEDAEEAAPAKKTTKAKGKDF